MLVRIDADREIIEDDLAQVLGDFVDGVVIREHLVVGDDHEQLDAEILELDPVSKGAEVVTNVQRPRRPIAREHAVTFRIVRQVAPDRGRAPHAFFEGSAAVFHEFCPSDGGRDASAENRPRKAEARVTLTRSVKHRRAVARSR